MLRSTLSNWREYLTPVSHQSTFENTGEITPDEFIRAGDYLCHMFPTWQWNDRQPGIAYRDFLPKNKQYLVTRKVPSNVRAAEYVSVEGTDKAGEDSYWVMESTRPIEAGNGEGKAENKGKSSVDIDELLQEMDIEGTDDAENDVVSLGQKYTRYYDLYIAYSTSYRVPKMYLVGFNSDGTPLTPQEMFQDIAPDYRTKTATIEKLPFFKASTVSVSIHPCKHANVMKVLMDKIRTVKQRQQDQNCRREKASNSDSDEEWEDLQQDVDNGLRVDQYMVVFLKFITSVTPGIEHDYTMDGW
ncbi:HER164Cp [Eremothecium sinecaudum]|uniref:Autophagy-related protein 3 n=1 Tax=Eremothecium sinecaudum TaxID=45286 RepID=A0A0X8HU42_9SACH|nr:HER164Cp [Eremothecium sinecaudum]AMD21443.1 HER164Cp [Eremothecium sinecaudum]